jgi:hypothetical protein
LSPTTPEPTPEPGGCPVDLSAARMALVLSPSDALFAYGNATGPLLPAGTDGAASRTVAVLRQRAGVSYSANVDGLFSRPSSFSVAAT